MLKKKSIIICCAVMAFATGILLYHALPATTYIEANASTVYMSLEEMSVKADAIIEGDVVSVGDSEWDVIADDAATQTMHTDVLMQPQQIIRGNTNLYHRSQADLPRIRIDVGQIENTIQTSSSLPSLAQGETSLLFLEERADDMGTYYTILGGMQGKFIAEEMDGVTVYTNGRDILYADMLQAEIERIAQDNINTVWASDHYTDAEIYEMNQDLFDINE